MLTLLALALLSASEIDAKPAPPPAFLPHVLDAAAALRVTALDNVPTTTLSVDQNGTWLTQGLYAPQVGQAYVSGFVLFDAEVEIAPSLTVHAMVDPGELRRGASLEPPISASVTANGQTLGAVVTSGAWLRELEAVVGKGELTFGIGKRRHSIGQGIVYDDFATGVTLEVPLADINGMPLHLELMGVLTGVSAQEPAPVNPLATVKVVLAPTFFEDVTLFATWFSDHGGALNNVLSGVSAERIIAAAATEAEAQNALTALFLRTRTNMGSLLYTGASCHLLLGEGWGLRAAGVISDGLLVLPNPGIDGLINNFAWAGHVELRNDVTDRVTLRGLLFLQSGDWASPPVSTGQQPYGAFIGIAPFLTYSGLFFTSGLNQGFFAGRATAAGVNGHGILGLGGIGELSGDWGRLEGRMLYMEALASAPPAPLAGGGTTYGMEADVVGSYALDSWVSLMGEVDILRTGSFFAKSTWAVRALGQIYVAWGS